MKRVKLLGIILSAALLVTGAPQAFLENNVSDKVYASPEDIAAEEALEESFTTKTVNIWQAGAETASDEEVILRYYDDMEHIPYIDIRDYYRIFPGEIYDGFTVKKTGDNTFP